MSGVICATVRRAMAVASLVATSLLVGSSTAAAAAVQYPVNVVTATMTLKNSSGASYIALPRKAKRMTATVAVTNVLPTSYRGPVKLRLQLDGLKLPKQLPAGVAPTSDGKALVWTIGSDASGKKLSLTGTTRIKTKATFGVGKGGIPDVDVANKPITLKRASGVVKLYDPKIGTLSNGERITFRGTIAAATCDGAGVGRVRLWGQFPGHRPLRSTSKANIRGPAVKKPGLCRFDITTGRFRQLEAYTVRPYRGRPFKFWVISRVDSKSRKSNTVTVNIDSSP